MFARKVTTRLQADSLHRFIKLVESAVVPWLKGQTGFRDLIILATADGRQVTTISFWDQMADAEAYNATGYPKVLQALAQLLDGVPNVQMFDVASSTFSWDCRPADGNDDLSPEVETGEVEFEMPETSA